MGRMFGFQMGKGMLLPKKKTTIDLWQSPSIVLTIKQKKCWQLKVMKMVLRKETK